MTSTGDAGSGEAIGQRYADTVRRLGHQPLLTFYDDRTGERTELSYATFDNWACKSANLLVEEAGAVRGTRLALGVTDHWTGAVLAAAAWKIGAAVAPDARPDTADVAVVAESDAAGWAGHPALIVIGRGMGGRATGAVDGIAFGDEVLMFGDHYDDPDVTPEDTALVAGGRQWTQAELLAAAGAGLGSAGSRTLTTLRLTDPAGVLAVLLGPLIATGSVVWCPHLPAGDTARRAEQERATPLP